MSSCLCEKIATYEAFLSFSPILLSFNLPSSTLSPFDGFLLVLYGDREFFALPEFGFGLLALRTFGRERKP
jgi:hypothetical protein